MWGGGDFSTSNSMVKHWVAKFKMGRTSTTDDPCVGCSTKVTTPEKIEKVYKIILADHRMKVSDTANTVGISTA